MHYTLTSKDDRAPYARKMREMRLANNKKLADCAVQLGVKVSTYAEMERNNVRFRRRDLVTLAVYYGRPLEEIFPVEARKMKKVG